MAFHGKERPFLVKWTLSGISLELLQEALDAVRETVPMNGVTPKQDKGLERDQITPQESVFYRIVTINEQISIPYY